MTTFNKRLIEALELRGKTQADLARDLGIPKSAVSHYVSGAYLPKSKRTYAIAKYLDVNEPWLMGADVSIERVPDEHRRIVKTRYPAIPLMGTIACGEPMFAESNIEEYVPLPKGVKADFCLRCAGDSMINARINDGDIVYIRLQSDVDDGQIAAVVIKDETTLKRVYRRGDTLILRPANPLYEDQVYVGPDLDQIRILGKAVAFTAYLEK